MKLIILFAGGNTLEITRANVDPEQLDWNEIWDLVMDDGKMVWCNPDNVDMVMLVEDDYQLDPPDNSWRVLK